MMLGGGGGEERGKSPPSTTDQEIIIILDRLRSARDPKDRSDAVAHLQRLGNVDPGRVGRLAVPLVVDLLRARRLGQLDEGTAQGLLELLRALLTHPVQGAGREVLLLLLKDAGNVDALLDMAEGTETFTTVATLQVIQAALDAGPHEMEGVLQSGGSQQGMVRLVACLSDEREEVRNEVLLVLGKLTAGSAAENLMTLLVFNEGFEHLLAMIEDDGGLLDGGGVITNDCLRLLGNVVEGTASTQRHFCELGPLDTMAPWMDVTNLVDEEEEEQGYYDNDGEQQQQREEEGGEEGRRAPRLKSRQIESFRLALRILRNLVVAGSGTRVTDEDGDRGSHERHVQDRQRRQRCLMECQKGGLLRSIVHLATAPFTEAEVVSKIQCQALALLAEVVEGNPLTQQALLDARVDPSSYPYLWPSADHSSSSEKSNIIRDSDRQNGSAYLSSILLRLALHAPLALVRSGALMIIHRVFEGNEIACIMAAQHIIAPPSLPLTCPTTTKAGYLLLLWV